MNIDKLFATIKDTKRKKGKINKGHAITFNLVRHGQAGYEEDVKKPETKKCAIQFEGEITLDGKEQIKGAAKEIIKQIINKEKELVILLRSPRNRAGESLDILKMILEKSRINVYPKVEIDENLADATLTQEFLDEFEEQKKQDKDLIWMNFWKKESGKFKNVESAEDFTKRMQALISGFQQFSLKAEIPEDKKIRFICLTHEEEIKNIAEHCGIKVDAVKNGEIMEMNIIPAGNEDEALIIRTKVGNEETERFSDQVFKKTI